MSKHIAIVGAGAGVYVAANRAPQLSAPVTGIESQTLGGVPLNGGCPPTNAVAAHKVRKRAGS